MSLKEILLTAINAGSGMILVFAMAGMGLVLMLLATLTAAR